MLVGTGIRVRVRQLKMVNCYVWGRAIFASLATFVFGYNIGSINGVQDMIDFRRTIGIELADNKSSACKLDNGNTSGRAESDSVETSAILGLVISILLLGSLVGALFAGALSGFAGRKPTMMTGGVLTTVGGVLQSAAYHIWMVILGRIISGIGLGILFMVVPVYIAEIAPSKLRGRLVSSIGVTVPGGILFGNLVNLGCAEFTFGWRISLSLQSVFMLIFTLGMILMPESPRWLVTKNRNKQASELLTRIYCSEGRSAADVENELLAIQEAVRATSSVTFRQELGYFFNWKLMRRFLVGLTLAAFNPIVGINTISFYSVTIFCNIGVAPYISTVVVGITNFLPSFQTVLFVDKLGRKGMLLLGSLGQLFATVGAATLILVFRVEEGENEVVGYIVVVFICFFVACYTSTWGVIPWIVNSELYPSKVKGVAVSLTTSASMIGTFATVQTSPIFLASSLGTYGSFYMLGVINVLALLFTLLFLPETKGESLERIEELFSKPWLQRVNLLYYLRCGCLCCCCDRRKEISWKCKTVQPISGKGFEPDEKEKEYENERMENPPPGVETKQRELESENDLQFFPVVTPL